MTAVIIQRPAMVQPFGRDSNNKSGALPMASARGLRGWPGTRRIGARKNPPATYNPISHHLCAFPSVDPYRDFEFINSTQGGKNSWSTGSIRGSRRRIPGSTSTGCATTARRCRRTARTMQRSVRGCRFAATRRSTCRCRRIDSPARRSDGRRTANVLRWPGTLLISSGA